MNIIHFQTKEKELSKIAYKINVGSSIETSNQWGVAHMVEHNIFKGNELYGNSIELNQKFKKIGYEKNAVTTTDYTYYHVSGLSELFREGLNLLTYLVFQPTFPEEEFIKEKNPILNELEMYESDPIAIFFEKNRQYLLGKSFEHCILGTRKSINKMKYSSMLTFYRKHYNLTNVTLIIKDHRTKNQIENILGTMKLIELIPKSKGRNKINLTKSSFDRKFKCRNKIFYTNTETNAIVFSHPSEGIKTKFNLLMIPLAEQIISDILYEEIRDKRGYATYSIGADFGREYYNGFSNIYALVSPDNLKIVLKEMKKILYDYNYLKSLITEELFLGNKLLRKVDLSLIYGQNIWGSKLKQFHNIHFQSFDQIRKIYDTISKESVLNFLKYLFSSKVSILQLKKKKSRKQGFD